MTRTAPVLMFAALASLACAGPKASPDGAVVAEEASASRSGFAMAPAASQPAPAAARALIWTAWLAVEVDQPPEAAQQVEALATGLGGYVEESSETVDGESSLRIRVPTTELDSVLDRIAALGEEKERRTSARDVTEQLGDLEATLATKRRLRDRLRELLDRAEKVKDLLEVERELARVQADIDRMQGRLDRLQGQVDLATVHVTLTPASRRVLGPLGYLAYGIRWFVTKLFVISP